MASPPSKPKGASRWGSLLSGAVAGLESRLDTILAEDNEASARTRAQEKAVRDKAAQEKETAAHEDTLAQQALPVPAPPTDQSRSSSRARQNDRLQERLAKALAGQRPSSEAPSRSSTPLAPTSTSPRSSLGSRPSTDVPLPGPDRQHDVPSTAVQPPPPPPSAPAAPAETSTLLTSGLPINPARISEDRQPRLLLDTAPLPSFEEPRPIPSVQDLQSTPSVEGSKSTPSVEDPRSTPPAEEFRSLSPIGTPQTESDTAEPEARTSAELETELARMRADHSEAEQQRQEEMHANLERIDALQAKLHYLAKETVAAAREANASARPGSLEQKLSEKDQRIALLMQEGEKLSKTEMRQLTVIKKMRARALNDERALLDTKKRMAELDESESDLKQKVRRLEQIERQNNERLKRYSDLERDFESRKSDLASSNATIDTLRRQLAAAEKRAEQAEDNAKETAVQVDAEKMSDLREQLEHVTLGKQLVEERSNKEIKRLAEEADRQRDQAESRESELSNEISNLEGRIEALRARAEEATSDMGGESQAKLLRQIETLQTQYSLAAENWRTIETSLNGRIAAIEKERDEAAKREADIRKKARDISNKSKQTEAELERASEEAQNLSQSLQLSRSEVKKLQSRLETAEASLAEAKAEVERQRLSFEAELTQKLEEERARSIRQGLGVTIPNNGGIQSSRTQSPTNYFRKLSTQDSLQSRRNLQRMPSQDQSASLSIDRSVSRRPSTLTPTISSSRTPMMSDFPFQSPGVSRHGSTTFSLAQLNGGATPNPSFHNNDVDTDDFDNRSSPQRTINDVISASTVHTGPSVQLVERMSSSIRRLEAEKAAHKDELARLVSQRDEARDEVVALMREVESKRDADGKADKVQEELAQVRKRYEACLEMLGEKEEQVEELKSDVVELKKIYRDLVEKSMD